MKTIETSISKEITPSELAMMVTQHMKEKKEDWYQMIHIPNAPILHVSWRTLHKITKEKYVSFRSRIIVARGLGLVIDKKKSFELKSLFVYLQNNKDEANF